MLLAYCKCSDFFKWHSEKDTIGQIANMFLFVLARWPWPVPFTDEKMVAIMRKQPVHGRSKTAISLESVTVYAFFYWLF